MDGWIGWRGGEVVLTLKVDDNVQLFPHPMKYPCAFDFGFGFLQWPWIHDIASLILQGPQGTLFRCNRAILPWFIFRHV